MSSREPAITRPYLAGLDGLRAIAVIAVLFYHLFPRMLPGGFIGVDIFFVISGFLITSLLITEHAQTGRIRLKEFWRRRARRLLPALFAVIVVTSSAALFINGDILVGLGRQILGAATFTSNWSEIAAGSDYFGATELHLFTNFWSLAVEEQFYAAWPFVVAAILAVQAAIARHRVGLWASLLLAVGSAAWMAVAFGGDNATRVYYGTDTHAFGPMFGAALAFLGNLRYAKSAARGQARPSARFHHPHAVQLLGLVSLVGVLALTIVLSESSAFTYRGGLVLASILTGIVIIAAVSKNGLLRRLLELQPLKWVGRRSYGIYLWHWPIIALLHYGAPSLPWWAAAMITVTATLGLSALSYRYLETPVRKEGIRAFLRRGVLQQTDTGPIRAWKLRIQPSAIVAVGLTAMTITAVIGAPQLTRAQYQVEEGRKALAKANAEQAKTQQEPEPVRRPITGSDITLVGDSVALASAPQLQAAFPGIYINAEVSRSMRRGGLETVEKLLQAKKMRHVLVVALGTNGHYGDGFVERLIKEVGHEREVIFVTAHAPVEWAKANNDHLRALAKKYKNMHVADWDKAISKHAGEIGPDGIHPVTEAGKKYYANCIRKAIRQIQPRN